MSDDYVDPYTGYGDGWYEDSDGDFMPGTPAAWDRLFEQAEETADEVNRRFKAGQTKRQIARWLRLSVAAVDDYLEME